MCQTGCSAFFSTCIMIPPDVFPICLPVPCSSFSSIVLKSSYKAYLLTKYSPTLKSYSCNCAWVSLASLPLAKYL